ncbi:hypothetical protein M9H77_13337 [Catharanthus roseus]|uniref:Uncharacterized protein n=1 Tax=Catharanthus roseus TaxID=4058 RepID=A0ACC0BK27_CATRO|nr:hypothetical protein M9H77_13337 [Catharanthus roseus]
MSQMRGATNNTPQVLQKNTYLNEASAENLFGPWMLVTSGRCRNPIVRKTRFGQIYEQGSFAQKQDNGPQLDNQETSSQLVEHEEPASGPSQHHLSEAREPQRRTIQKMIQCGKGSQFQILNDDNIMGENQLVDV